MQEARGASLSSGDNTPSPRRRRALALFGAVAVAAYAIDQVTKALATEHLSASDKVPLIGDLLTLTLVYNPGAAFGTGTKYTWVFTCLAIVATGVVLFLLRQVRDRVWAVGLGLLLAGIVGNLTDRILRAPEFFHGHVVDFLQLPNWPVFNVADMCINAAAVLIVVQAFRGVHLDGTRDRDEQDLQDQEEAA